MVSTKNQMSKNWKILLGDFQMSFSMSKDQTLEWMQMFSISMKMLFGNSTHSWNRMLDWKAKLTKWIITSGRRIKIVFILRPKFHKLIMILKGLREKEKTSSNDSEKFKNKLLFWDNSRIKSYSLQNKTKFSLTKI